MYNQTQLEFVLFFSCSSQRTAIKSNSHLSKKLFYLLQRKPFKNDEKCFLLILKTLFVHKIFRYLS